MTCKQTSEHKRNLSRRGNFQGRNSTPPAPPENTTGRGSPRYCIVIHKTFRNSSSICQMKPIELANCLILPEKLERETIYHQISGKSVGLFCMKYYINWWYCIFCCSVIKRRWQVTLNRNSRLYIIYLGYRNWNSDGSWTLKWMFLLMLFVTHIFFNSYHRFHSISFFHFFRKKPEKYGKS